MVIQDLHTFKDELDGQEIIFCFSGPLSQRVLVGIGETLKQKMRLDNATTSTTQKVFSVLVEQIQNIINHSVDRSTPEEDDEHLSEGIIIVGFSSGHYFVDCGNRMEAEGAAQIAARLDLLRDMDGEQLKAYYKEERKRERAEGQRGAGLGFIEMARKASKPIEYDIKALDEGYAFLGLRAVI